MKNSYRKPFRISKQKDIVYLLGNGQRWKCNIFAVIYTRNELDQDRLGVLVGKKNGGAVERVRIKRVFREAFINTEIENSVFYDILIRPYYDREHTFQKVKQKYEQWRCTELQKSSL